MSNKHTLISPSGADRWMSCPGSIALCKTVPRKPSSKYAKEGTAAHALLEVCLRNPKASVFDFVGTEIEGWMVNDDMAEAVSFAIDVVRQEMRKGGKLIMEERFEIFPGVKGRVDIMIVRDYQEVIVLDYKHGKRSVRAADNPQLLMYAIPAARKYDVNKFRVGVIQPRTETQYSEWECDMEYMRVFEQECKRKIEMTEDPAAPRLAGSWCRYCDADMICPEKIGVNAKALAPIKNSELMFPHASSLSPANLKRVLDNKEDIEKWLDGVYSYATQFVDSGGEIEGWEMAAKRANRRWKDEKKALAEFADLGEDILNVKIKSPAQVEKIAGKERVEELTEKPDNGTVLRRIKENGKRKSKPSKN